VLYEEVAAVSNMKLFVVDCLFLVSGVVMVMMNFINCTSTKPHIIMIVADDLVSVSIVFFYHI